MDTESGLPPKLDLTGEEFMKSDGVNEDHSTSVPVTSQHKNKSNHSTVNPNIQKLNAKTEELKAKVSPAVQEMLNKRKQLLHKLWEDIDETWTHRENFVHHAFDRPFENYGLISNETLRVVEIRWLDLRILGLIDQRETIIERIQEVSEKRNPRDLKKNQQLIEEDIQIYRTITLYITEYIQTWILKNPQKETYLWKGEDYLARINIDFTRMIRKSRRLQTILEENHLTNSPLCLPKNPTLYMKDYQPKKTIEEGHTIEKQVSDSVFDHRSRTPTAYNIAQFDLGTPMTSTSQPTTPLQLSRGLMNGVSKDKEPRPNAPISPTHAQPVTQFGKVIKFQKKVVFEEEKDQFFLTSVQDSNSKTKQSDGAASNSFNENLDHESDEMGKRVNLPSLLVEQTFRDRNKRYKKYSEPLCSIRHEDLMDKLQEEQPFYLNDLIQQKRNKPNDPLNSSAIMTSHLSYVQQILAKSNNYLRKMQETRTNLEVPKFLSSDPVVQVDQSAEIEDLDVQFPGTNLAEDIIRIQRASRFISNHSQKGSSRATTASSSANPPHSANSVATPVAPNNRLTNGRITPSSAVLISPPSSVTSTLRSSLRNNNQTTNILVHNVDKSDTPSKKQVRLKDHN